MNSYQNSLITMETGLRFRPIDRMEHFNPEQFLKNHFSAERPLVIKDFASNWQAMKKWDANFFIENYGNNQVKVYDSNFGTPGKKYMSSLKVMSLGEYLRLMVSGQTTLRMFLYNIIKEAPELKAHVELPRFVRGFSKNFMFMFFGASGSVTQMHYDIDMSHVFHTAFSGKKRFYLYPQTENRKLYRHPYTIRSYVDILNPDYERFPALKDAIGDFVELNPGETLFIPAGYWHHVVYDEPSIALSLRCAHSSFWRRLEGLGNILFMQMVDRLVNKIDSQKWFKWKEQKAAQLAKNS